MKNFVAADLPDVDCVEIIRLGRVQVDGRSIPQTLENADDALSVKVEGSVAQDIADLWRQLPFAGQMRCHIPPFALRFFQNNQMVLHASICWMCNNIWVIQDNKHYTIEFDARADVSRQLFLLLKTCFPNEDIEEFYGDD